MNVRISTAFAVLVLLSAATSAPAQKVTFAIIPGVTSANDMTPDGRFVVGESGGRGYIYDVRNNTVVLLPAPGKTAAAISDDGTVVVGDMPDPNDPTADVAGRWTVQGGWTSLGYLPRAGKCPSRSNAYEVSADGSVVVGLSWDGCNGRAFVWTQQTGMQQLEVLGSGGNRASVVSADGKLVGGFAQGAQSRTPVYWDATTLNGDLLDPNGFDIGEVFDVHDNGHVLLGTYGGQGDPHALAVRWDLEGGQWVRRRVAKGSINPDWVGAPMDIDNNGTIVGFDYLGQGRVAWILLPGATDMTDLKQYITDHGGEPPAYGLHVCQAISRDGRLICGHTAFSGAWLVRIALGDLNCDGAVDFGDINPFVLALSDPEEYKRQFPDCDINNGDCNQDGRIDFGDINPFVDLLAGG